MEFGHLEEGKVEANEKDKDGGKTFQSSLLLVI